MTNASGLHLAIVFCSHAGLCATYNKESVPVSGMVPTSENSGVGVSITAFLFVGGSLLFSLGSFVHVEPSAAPGSFYEMLVQS